MPHHRSTAKRVKTSERARERNRAVKSEVRAAIRRLRENAGEENADELLRQAQSSLDNAARKGIIHRKTVDRRKSRLARVVNRARSGPAQS
jgi:small subunit ribosomal protein S20